MTRYVVRVVTVEIATAVTKSVSKVVAKATAPDATIAT